ncbi:hypothetical protein [Burkholderia stagnalis]|uniref:hypothetical protein n=1 Tax=Burkholderia stagnalis TaxID=1503054 RepID=UPI000B0C9A81|nr:hypothetical protein [Burkholderia stagnalis]
MTRSMYLRVAAACVALALGVVATAAHAHDGDAGSDNVRPVMKQAVPEAPGKLAVVATVDYAPGQASEPHRHLVSHNASVALVPSVHKHRARHPPGSIVQLKKMFFNTTYTMKPISAVKAITPTIFCPRVLGAEPGIPTIFTT